MLIRPFYGKIIKASPDMESERNDRFKKIRKIRRDFFKKKNDFFEKYMNGDVSVDDFTLYLNKINDRIKALDNAIDKSYSEILNHKVYMFETSNESVQYSVMHRSVKSIRIDFNEKNIKSIKFFNDNESE